MDAYQTFELVLSCVKNSNLNFLLNESPFAASITIKKSFIKNQDGSVRAANISTSIPRDNVLVNEKVLKSEILSLKNIVSELENNYIEG